MDNGGSFVGAIAKASLVDFWNIFITLYIHYFLIVVFYVCISIPFFCLGSSPLWRLLNYCTPSSDNTCMSGPAASSVLITPTKLIDISCEISVCSAFKTIWVHLFICSPVFVCMLFLLPIAILGSITNVDYPPVK